MISPEEKKAVVDLFPFMGENPIVFDIGGNKGHWADIVLEEFKDNCNLHIVEPNDKLCSFMEIKYEYSKNITYYRLPFYRDATVVPFHYFENFNNELSGIYDGCDKWDGLPVKTKSTQSVTLDGYCDMRSVLEINYLKIDTEGSDMDVLLGAKKMLSENKIGIIQIEYSEHWQRAEYNFSNLKDIADKYGYKIYRYRDGNFWEEKSTMPEFDNYFLTKYEIHNYSVGGWNNNFILSTADLPKMDLVLEVGAFEGLMTKYICENLLNEGGRVIVVDPLFDYYVKDDPRHHPEFKHQYQRFLRNTRGLPVELKRGKSDDELPKLVELKCDFCFIDGDHYPPAPYNDAINVFKMTRNGGYILFDDFDLWAQETKDNIDKFLNEYAPYIKIINKGYQCLIQKIIDP